MTTIHIRQLLISSNMTELLYMEDIEANYIEGVEGDVERAGDDYVVLNRSAFYPEGGGQPSDTGVLEWKNSSADVVKVEKKGDVIHRLDGPIPEKGTEVKGEIDWDKRYAHMKLHTAQHLFSAILYEDYGGETAGNQIYTDYSRIDFEPVDLSEEDIIDVEKKVNARIKEAHPVNIYEEDRDELEEKLEEDRVQLSLLPDSIDVLRVVDIDGLDICPCAGTHVKNTEEIGSVKITKVENKGKDRQRLYYQLK